jgi:hypothetical protein
MLWRVISWLTACLALQGTYSMAQMLNNVVYTLYVEGYEVRAGGNEQQ